MKHWEKVFNVAFVFLVASAVVWGVVADSELVGCAVFLTGGFLMSLGALLLHAPKS